MSYDTCGEVFLDLLTLFSQYFHQPQKLYESFIYKVLTEIKAQRCILMLLGSDKELHVHCALDENKNTIKNLRSFSRSLPVEAIKNRSIVYRKKTFGQKENILGTESMDAFDIRSVLCVPLITSRSVIGVLYLDSQTIISDFSQKDRSLVQALCQHLALHIENAAIIQAQRQQVEMQKEKLQSELAYLKNLSPEKKRLMGNSQAIQNTMNQVYKVAATSASILLTGETGAGKEFIAKIIHDLSDRRNQPFITIDCTTIPENLIESELFGHEKGSFTSASSLQKGKFESASKGTVFLDEIGELSLHLQKKLLRVLQENTITRVGGNKEISIDIRVIAATNRNLDEMVANKSFRQDLYYRLNVVNIKVPPLRARKTDIITLAEYFLQKFCSEYKKCPQNYSNKSVDAMLAYDWPGNVRELIHRVQRAVIMSTSSEINSADLELDDELTEPPVPEAQSEQSILEKLESATAQLVDDCIQKTNNTNLFSSIVQPGVKAAIEYSLWQADQNKSHAAWLLGIERRQLSRLKLKYNDAPENDTPHSKAYMKIIQEILDWRNQFSRKSRELSNLVIAMESFTAKAVFAHLNSNISKTAAALGLTPERTKKLLKV